MAIDSRTAHMCYVFSFLARANDATYSDLDLPFGSMFLSLHHFSSSNVLIDILVTLCPFFSNSLIALFAFFRHCEYDSSTPFGSSFDNSFHWPSSN